MGTLNTFLSEQTIQHIGWVLVHFLWQGCAVMALMWCSSKILSKASSSTRYVAACLGLVLMVSAPIVTFMILNVDSSTIITEAAPIQMPVVSTTPAPLEKQNIIVSYAETTVPEQSPMQTVIAQLEAALPFCVIGWIVGVAALSLWYLGGWCQLQRLRRIGTKSVADGVIEKTSELANRLGINRCVHIAESALVQVPTVIGWLKPIILLPASALTGLDEIQLKAMIAHELAHIKRCDYLVNIAQTVVEILGFYHPAVWWASRQIRVERENACDDIAVNLLQNRTEYAKALFSMEEIRAKQLNLAVAANGAPLTNRIHRLIGNKSEQHPKSGWVPSVITILLVTALLITTAMAMSNKTSPAITHEQLQKLFEVYSTQIQTIDATFTLQRRNTTKTSIDLKWDRETFFVNASLVGEQPLNPRMKKWIRNSNYEWHSMPERAPQKELDGSWIVEIDSAEEKMAPWVMDKSEFGIEWIEKSIVPYHILYKEQINSLPDSTKITMVSQETDDEGFHHIIYESRKDGKSMFQLEYIIDLSDGMKLLSTISTDMRFENPKANSRIDCYDFKKINGLWFPLNIKEKVWDVDGTIIANESLVIKRITLNEEFPAETFTYIPPLKSKVHDNVTNRTYRVGQEISSRKIDDLNENIPNKGFTEEDDSPQIMTTAYLVSVPADFPEFKDIFSEDKSEAKMIAPEILESFLNSVENNPKAKIIANPRILTNEGEVGEIKIGNDKDPEHIKLKVNNHIAPNGESIRTDIDFQRSLSVEQGGVMTQNVVSMVTTLPGYPFVAGGVDSNDDKLLLLVKPEILKDASSKIDIPESPQAIGGMRVVTRKADEPTGNIDLSLLTDPNAPHRDQIRFPKNWDEISKQRGGLLTEAQIRQRMESERQLLETKIDFSPLTTDTTIEEAINLIRNNSTPPLQIVVLWGDLAENAFIEKESPVNVDGLGIMKLETGLRIITKSLSVSGMAPINFVVDENVITIATESSLPTLFRNEVYDVTELIIPPHNAPLSWTPADGIEEFKQTLIKSIVPESWFENGGEGRIRQFAESKLIIWQTPQVHEKIQNYLKNLREALSIQVTIEARYILIDNDSFLEDIGIDRPDHIVGEVIEGPANSDAIKTALEPKPLDERILPFDNFDVLDDLQIDFLIKATQQSKNAKVLTAPKAVVLNGEPTSLQVFSEWPYTDIDGKAKYVLDGVMLDILPVLQKDTKEILLKAQVLFSNILENDPETPDDIPYMQATNIPVHTMVESSGTILVIGPKVKPKPKDEDAGSKEKQRLLILIKPTVVKPSTEEESAPLPAMGRVGSRGGARGGGRARGGARGGYGARGGGDARGARGSSSRGGARAGNPPEPANTEPPEN